MKSKQDTVGSRIKLVRKSLKMKQRDFARRLSFSVTSLSVYERGLKNPHFDFLFNLASKYNVNLEFLFFGKGEPFNRKGTDYDNFREGKSFGQFTDNVKEMLWYMERSNWALGAVTSYFKEYLARNKKDIEKDLRSSNKKIKKEEQ